MKLYHLPYGMTQCFVPPEWPGTSEHTPP